MTTSSQQLPVDTVLSFNIYLVRKGVENDARALLPSPQVLNLPDLDNARFSLIPSERRVPVWFAAIQPLLAAASQATDVSLPFSEIPAALIVCDVAGRTVLISFGSAHTQVKKAMVEPHFGRKVAMNAVPPDQVLEFQARQVFASFHHLSERAPGATAHRNFGVEGDRDLVAVVEGLASKPGSLGRRIRGGTSLTIEIELGLLPKALKEALRLFKAPAQFAEWSEFDNLLPVVDLGLITQLDGALDAYLATQPANLTLAAPGDEELPASITFHVGRLTSPPAVSPVLYPQALYGQVDDPVTASKAKTAYAHIFDAKDMTQHSRVSLYDCICFETTVNQEQYVLWSGRWYQAGTDFCARVRKRIAAISAPGHLLPPWNGKDNEHTYNKSTGAPAHAGFQMLDRQLARFGGGKSAFEHCDIVHAQSKTLYFVKHYSSSATMSHLVEQVRRTAELFFSADGRYRKKMKTAGFAVPTARPRQGEWRLCLVVMGRQLAKLPFFAQCAIARLVTDLERNQHVVLAQAV